MRKVIFLFFFLLFAFYFFKTPSEAAVKTWNPAGCASSSVIVAGNWSGGLPGTGDIATFDGAVSNCNATVDSAVDVGGINITGSYTGTITQGNGNDITIRGSGYTQNATGSTFTGGDSTSDINFINSAGGFTLTSGTFNAPNGTISIGFDWTISGGTFNANSGTLSFTNVGSATISPGTETYHDISFTSNGKTFAIASGKTMKVGGSLFVLSTNSSLNGPGNMTVQGDITHNTNNGLGGTAVITVNGTGTQTWSGGSGGGVPGLKIDKPSGTFVIKDYEGVGGGDWEIVRGTVDAVTYQSQVLIGAGNQSTTLTGDTTFYNLSKSDNCALADIASGTTITVANTLTMSSNCGAYIDGPGALVVQGDINQSSLNSAGVGITLTGSKNQTISVTGAANLPSGTFTINKTAGTVSLSSNINLSGSGQDMVISSGVLNAGQYNLTVNDVLTISGQLNQTTGNVSADTISIGTKGIWMNNSSGDVTIGAGGLSNAGYLRLNGGGAECGDNNTISITSSTGGVARNWAGAGTFIINDVTVQDQNDSGITITAYSSTLTSNSDWVFNSGCPTYSNRSSSGIGEGATIIGGTTINSN